MVDIRIFRGFGQAQAWQALKQDRQGGLQFKPGKWCADAEMQTGAKTDMRFGRPRRVELVGVVPDLRIAVGGCQQHRHLIAALKPVAEDVDIGVGPAGEHVQGGIEPQDFLDGGVGVGKCCLGAGFQHGFDAIADGMDGRLVPRVQQQDAGGDQLVGGQPVTGCFGGDQVGDQIIGRACAALADIVAQERGKVIGGGDGAVFARAVAARHIHADHRV